MISTTPKRHTFALGFVLAQIAVSLNPERADEIIDTLMEGMFAPDPDPLAELERLLGMQRRGA